MAVKTKPKKKREKKTRITDRVILDEYINNGMNGVQAWMATHPRSSYAAAAVSVSKWLKKANIQEEIRERLKEKAMSADEVLARVSDHARGNHQHFIRINSDGFVEFDFSHPDAQNHLHLIKKIKTKRTRRLEGRGKNAEPWEDEWIEVELHDPQRALELLGKHHKLFIERTEHSGPDGGPIPFDLDEWKKQRAERLKTVDALPEE